ncbi:DUF1735 and LamG domain-containing protein [uncultured Alistipes sp.]|uniref:DUF1735 and LamG domain-containing protein n=1 Tax=uncultured Alistipes sp. TaxID=538949 RepID=UPI0025EA4619|nr:DUF1735 and LamG domain-containing protein [uncultured Alistipes sp.]
MKIKSIITILAAAAIAVGCQESQEYQDVVYFTGTEDSNTTSMYADGPADMGISVTASCKAPADIRVTLEFAPDELDAYNFRNGTAYQLLPNNSYSLSNNEVIISEGKHVSAATKFQLTTLNDFEEGVTYCMPLRIAGNSAGLGTLAASKVTFVVIKEIITTRCVNLRGSTYFTMSSMIGDSTLDNIDACTMECRVYMNSFPSATANPGIQSVIGVEENFLLRFGDISCDKNQLQLAGGGASVTTDTRFNTAQWYHIAVVDTGSTLTLYVNGVADMSIDSSGRGAINLGWDYRGGFHIGFSESGRLMNGYVSEARVWRRALTPAELRSNQCYVDPTSDGLIGYWRMDGLDSETGKLKDLSGHGYDGSPSNTVTWIEGIKCPIVD